MSKLIFQPVKPLSITQKFGENKACVSLDGSLKVISCDGNNPPTGYKSLYGAKGHQAIDIRTSHGQEVYCAQDGIVVGIDTEPKTGLDVKVEHIIKGEKYMTVYEHLMGYQVKVGDKVRVGQLLGWADNTGYSSGDHLHFMFRKWDGKKYVSLDPLEYMEPIFALDWLATENKFMAIKEKLAKLLDNWASSIRDGK